MMEKETSTRRSLLRALYLLPLVCISLVLNAQTKVNYVYDNGKNSSGQLSYDNNKTKAQVKIVYDEIKMDGEALENMTIDDITRMLPDVKKDADGNLTSQGNQIKRVVINGKVLYKKEGTANEVATTPKISVIDSQSSMDMEISGMSEESVDGIIKSLPGVGFDENGQMTINGKAVRKILVNGKEYISDAQSPIYANDIVDEVEGKAPEGYSRNIIVNVDEKDQVSIKSEDKPDSKFNATAVRLPEGTNMEELINNLPGVETDADGNITVNGKRVSRVLVNGKAVPMNEADSIARALLKQSMEK